MRIQNVGGIIAEAPMAAISIGDDTIIYENARIEAYGSGQIVIGAGSVIGDVRIYSRARVDIGARALFSWNVFIQDYTPHPVDPKLRAQQMRMIVRDFYPRYDGGVAPEKDTVLPWGWEFPVAAVTIGSDVWFGANSTVLPGARIGDGCVIASGSVVVRGDYPPRSVLAGNPARIVRTLE